MQRRRAISDKLTLMWGNTLGWIISIVLLGGMLFGLRAIDSLQKISPATDFGKDPKTLASISLPVSPDTVVRMGEAGEAGPIYRQAIDDYLAHQSDYERIASDRPTDTKGLRAVELIISATDKSTMTIFSSRPEEIVNFEPNKPALAAIDKLGTLTLQIGLRQKEPGDARRYAEAVFSLGAKLFRERLTVAELTLGLRMMREGGTMIASQARKAGATADADNAQKFLTATAGYYQSDMEPVLRVLTSIDARTVGAHPGDYFFIARNADERVWRVAAIYGLGRMRFFAGEGGALGDQRGAAKVLGELSSDKDPVVATAARAAAAMTREQYQLQD